jgi:hypothetical protein
MFGYIVASPTVSLESFGLVRIRRAGFSVFTRRCTALADAFPQIAKRHARATQWFESNTAGIFGDCICSSSICGCARSDNIATVSNFDSYVKAMRQQCAFGFPTLFWHPRKLRPSRGSFGVSGTVLTDVSCTWQANVAVHGCAVTSPSLAVRIAAQADCICDLQITDIATLASCFRLGRSSPLLLLHLLSTIQVFNDFSPQILHFLLSLFNCSYPCW